SPGRVPVAAGGDVGVLPEGRLAQARDAQPDLRRHDAVHDHRLYLPRLHVHLARDDALAPGVSLRQVDGCAVVGSRVTAKGPLTTMRAVPITRESFPVERSCS